MPQQFSLYAPVPPTLSQNAKGWGTLAHGDSYHPHAEDSYAKVFRIPLMLGRINCLNEDAL